MKPTEALRLPLDTPGLNPEAIRLINDRLARLASSLPAASPGPVIQATHEMRLARYLPKDQVDGTPLLETNRSVTYIARGGHWAYWHGRMVDVLAKIPTDLTPHDAGFLFHASDFDHTWAWDGTQWDWAPDDDQAGYLRDWPIAPSGTGWRLCDGSATTYVDRRAATHAFTTPDMTAGGYRKGGTWTGAVVAAGTASLSGNTSDVSAGTPAGTVAAPTLTMDAYTPAGTVAAPTLTMDSYTPAGTVGSMTPSLNLGLTSIPMGAPSFTGTAHVLTGTIAAPAFSGTPEVLTGTAAAPTFTGTALATHHHDLSTATITITGDLQANLSVPVYFRR